jgi:hypothetical protein
MRITNLVGAVGVALLNQTHPNATINVNVHVSNSTAVNVEGLTTGQIQDTVLGVGATTSGFVNRGDWTISVDANSTIAITDTNITGVASRVVGGVGAVLGEFRSFAEVPSSERSLSSTVAIVCDESAVTVLRLTASNSTSFSVTDLVGGVGAVTGSPASASLTISVTLNVSAVALTGLTFNMAARTVAGVGVSGQAATDIAVSIQELSSLRVISFTSAVCRPCVAGAGAIIYRGVGNGTDTTAAITASVAVDQSTITVFNMTVFSSTSTKSAVVGGVGIVSTEGATAVRSGGLPISQQT